MLDRLLFFFVADLYFQYLLLSYQILNLQKKKQFRQNILSLFFLGGGHWSSSIGLIIRGQLCPGAQQWLSVCQHCAPDVCSPWAMIHINCFSSCISGLLSVCLSMFPSQPMYLFVSLRSTQSASRHLFLSVRCLLQQPKCSPCIL